MATVENVEQLKCNLYYTQVKKKLRITVLAGLNQQTAKMQNKCM